MNSSEEYEAIIAALRPLSPEHRDQKRHRLPLDRYCSSEHEFFFTICARHQGKPFLDDKLAMGVVESLLWRKQHHRWVLHCYCLMPDHLHFIVKLEQSEDRMINAGVRGILPYGILDQIGDFKKYTTTQVWWKMNGSGQLWQRSSYDRVLRMNDSVDAAMQYVLNNPVRKGLVSEWSDYPYAAIVDAW